MKFSLDDIIFQTTSLLLSVLKLPKWCCFSLYLERMPTVMNCYEHYFQKPRTRQLYVSFNLLPEVREDPQRVFSETEPVLKQKNVGTNFQCSGHLLHP